MRFGSLPRVAVGLVVAVSACVVPGFGQSSTGVEQVIVPDGAPVADPAVPAPLPVAAAETAENPVAASPEKSPEDKEIERLRKERDRIAAENALAQEKLRQELFALDSEKQRLGLENSLRRERLEAELAETRTRLDRMQVEIDQISKQSALDSARRRDQLERELADLRAEEERLKLANSIANQKIDARLAEMRVLDTELKIQRAQLDMDVARLQTELTRREKSEVLRDLAPDGQKYTTEPFKDGVLVVSDRRIALNGVIAQSVADHIAERIDYFNNQNTEYPIFLVIDYSPGGSLLAGEKILKAMEGSQAPVYVVVKSYAASMAAIITTLAKHSFSYPNAIMVHHQPSGLVAGNLTQRREQLQWSEQWWRRVATPLAAKMGLTLDQLIKTMYEKNSDGDWVEFADSAKKLKWVDDVVDTIWETSLDKNPDRFGPRPMVTLQLEEKLDEQGRPYVFLPRLLPFDAYLVYNPDGYYRVR